MNKYIWSVIGLAAGIGATSAYFIYQQKHGVLPSPPAQVATAPNLPMPSPTVTPPTTPNQVTPAAAGDSNDMQWFFDRFGESTWLDPSQFNVKTFTTDEYHKLMAAAPDSEIASVALRITILKYLKEHPDDPDYKDLKAELYSADFLAAQHYYFQQLVPELPPDLLDNRALFLEIVKRNGYALRWASERLRNDPELARLALANCNFPDCVNFMNYLPDQILSNRQFMLEEAKAGHGFISNLKGGLNNDKEIVLTLMRTVPSDSPSDESQLHYVGKDIINDPEIVDMIRKYATGFADVNDIPPALRNDPDFMLKMIGRNCSFLSVAPTKLRDDKGLVSSLVEQNPLCLQFASEHLQNDPGLLSISRKHFLESNASYVFAGNVPQGLRNDKDFMSQMIAKNCALLSIAPPDLKDDEDLVRGAIVAQSNPSCLKFASERLQQKLKDELSTLTPPPANNDSGD